MARSPELLMLRAGNTFFDRSEGVVDHPDLVKRVQVKDGSALGGYLFDLCDLQTKDEVAENGLHDGDSIGITRRAGRTHSSLDPMILPGTFLA